MHLGELFSHLGELFSSRRIVRSSRRAKQAAGLGSLRFDMLRRRSSAYIELGMSPCRNHAYTSKNHAINLLALAEQALTNNLYS